MQDFEKKVSVIVPIYNVEKYIGECIESLINQTFPKEDIQVLLINDGSTDGTAGIIKSYTETYDFLEYYEKENGGVSDARNYGMKNSIGKYIMFLDSDDKLSPETVGKCVDFFEEHYDEIDVATYLIQPFNADGELPVESRFQSYKDYGKKSEILDLDNNPYLYLEHINIIIKNTGGSNIEFKNDVCGNIIFTALISNIKKKYGIVSECTYYYRRDNENSITSAFFPTVAFEPFICSMEELFHQSVNWRGEVALHVQMSFIGELLKKTLANMMFPYHYSDEDFETANNRIDALLERVNPEIIFKFPKSDIFHRHWLMSRKRNLNAYIRRVDDCYSVFYGKLNRLNTYNYIIPNIAEVLDFTNKPDIIFRNTNNEWLSITESKKICDLTNLVLSVTRIVVVNGKLTFYGFIKSGFYNYTDEDINLWYTEWHDTEVKDVKLKTFWARESNYHCRTQTNRFFGFVVDLDLNYVRRFRFYVTFRDGATRPGSFWFHTLVGLKEGRIIRGGYRIDFDGNDFYIAPCDIFHETDRLTESLYKDEMSVYLNRKISTVLRQTNKIHIYIDVHYVNIDNAYYQFKNDFYKQDGIQRYYIASFKEEEYDRLFTPQEQKYVVQSFSEKHCQLYLAAEKLFTSFIGSNKHCPFMSRDISKFADMFDFEIIYLGHGVLNGVGMVSYHIESGYTDKFIISADMEYKNLIENYNWRTQSIIATGAPRYNNIDRNIVPYKKILFAPSWRSYFSQIDLRNKEEFLNVERFKNHMWHKAVYKFLTSPELIGLLEEHDYTLDFKPHPIISGAPEIRHIYSKLFDENRLVRIVTEDVKIEEYAVYITDYSSFTFDFVYLNRAIMYFFPDYDEWRSGIYHYREVAVPFEEAFGPFTTEVETAIENLRKILENNAVPEDIYADRMKDFFLPMSDNICDDIYNNILNEQI